MASRRLCAICKSPWPMHTALCGDLQQQIESIPPPEKSERKEEARMAPLTRPRILVLEGVDGE